MIKVKFFGLLRLDLQIKELFLEASTVKELLSEVARQTDKISARELRGYLIYVNGTLSTKLKGYRTKLSDGDEVIIMNPSSGG